MGTGVGSSVQAGASVPTESVGVYRALDGGFHHARCGRRMLLARHTGRFSLEFYCVPCVESVTLPLHVLWQVPVADDTRDDAA